MKKNLTELVFILDRSGSMAGLEKDTIGGFNSMIARQRAAEGEALVSTVLFSNESKVIHDRIDVRRVEPLTERQYVACGCTALLDAIGGAIHHIGNVHKYAREEDRPEHTLFVITTDGMLFSSLPTMTVGTCIIILYFAQQHWIAHISSVTFCVQEKH